MRKLPVLQRLPLLLNPSFNTPPLLLLTEMLPKTFNHKQANPKLLSTHCKSGTKWLPLYSVAVKKPPGVSSGDGDFSLLFPGTVPSSTMGLLTTVPAILLKAKKEFRIQWSRLSHLEKRFNSSGLRKQTNSLHH